MAMLAEPKRKNKYSVDPRGKAWSDDDSKFGQKLMEKMGWSKGKGLGTNEDGNVHHIAVQVKTDQRGVGCTKSHADNWIAHQDDFNALLSGLQQTNSSDSGGGGEEKVSSLESKSRSSKGRVNYTKFARGKDLSMKKAEDLDCIFGRRKKKPDLSASLTDSVTLAESAVGTETGSTECGGAGDDVMDCSHGIVTVKHELSTNDYFAKKLAELKAKRGASNSVLCSNGGDSHDPGCEPQPIAAEEAIDGGPPRKKKKKKEKKRTVDSPVTKEISDSQTCEHVERDKKTEDYDKATKKDKTKIKKKKKLKKSRLDPDGSGLERCKNDEKQ